MFLIALHLQAVCIAYNRGVLSHGFQTPRAVISLAGELPQGHQGTKQHKMLKLVSSFNPATVEGLLCRDLISVSWDGQLYDCDVNQMIDLPLVNGLPQTIGEFDLAALIGRRINTANHC